MKAKFKKGTMGTTDYKNLKNLKNNRGKDDSVEMKRVNDLVDIIKCNTDVNWIDMAGSRVTVNIYGIIVDGHHTAFAHHKAGLPIPYYVTTSDSLNVKDFKKLIVPISDYNSWSSKWSKRSAYNTAVRYEFELAQRISEIIDEISAKTAIDTNKFAQSWIFALLNKDKKLFKASKNLDRVRAYIDDELIEYSKTDEFAKDLNYFINLVKLFSSKIERFVAPAFEIMHLYWGNPVFDIDRMIERLKNSGFNPENEKIPSLRYEIQKVYNTQRGRMSEYHQLYSTIVAHKVSDAITPVKLYKFAA